MTICVPSVAERAGMVDLNAGESTKAITLFDRLNERTYRHLTGDGGLGVGSWC